MVKAFDDLRCGLHSGIPLCCIAWYLGPWRWIAYGRAPRLRKRYWDAFKGFDYIACPFCILRNRPVVVATCRCGRDPV